MTNDIFFQLISAQNAQFWSRITWFYCKIFDPGILTVLFLVMLCLWGTGAAVGGSWIPQTVPEFKYRRSLFTAKVAGQQANIRLTCLFSWKSTTLKQMKQKTWLKTTIVMLSKEKSLQKDKEARGWWREEEEDSYKHSAVALTHTQNNLSSC